RPRGTTRDGVARNRSLACGTISSGDVIAKPCRDRVEVRIGSFAGSNDRSVILYRRDRRGNRAIWHSPTASGSTRPSDRSNGYLRVSALDAIVDEIGLPPYRPRLLSAMARLARSRRFWGRKTSRFGLEIADLLHSSANCPVSGERTR